MSALAVFGSDLQEFEYETLRLECRRRGIDVASQNWEELYAALALRGDGRFLADAMTFENTAVAFNGGEPDARSLQPTIPAHIAWAVKEADVIVADLISGTIDEYLDYEPVSYTAVMCKAYGMVAVPECLEFCEERLEELTPEKGKLRTSAKKMWDAYREDPDAHPARGEDPVDVQLALMQAAHAYVEDRTEAHDVQTRRLLGH